MISRLDKLLAFYEKDSTDTFIRYGIALEYRSLQNYSTAIEWLEGLRQSASDYLPTYLMLGELYAFLGKNELAKTVFQEGIIVARKCKDMHTLAEIRAALHDVEDED